MASQLGILRIIISRLSPKPTFLGARSIIQGDLKLVLQETNEGQLKQELFDLEKDPAESQNIVESQSAEADELARKLRQWQQSVLNSLREADYTD